MAGRTWAVLGASSTVARAFARLAAAEGDAVLLAGRDHDDLSATAADLLARGAAAVEVIAFDAASRDDRIALAARCAAVPPGTLDVMLAFGLMPEQTAMEADPDLAVACIEATYTGAVDLLLRLGLLLERAPGGRVAILGSVAGDRGRLKNHVYGSAKAGLAAFASGFRARMVRRGVIVTTIKPGFLDTAMTWGLPGIFLAAAPADAAAQIWRATIKGREVVYVPFFWRFIMLIIRHIPEKIFKKLSI